MALTKVTGQVVNTSTDLTVGVLTATTVAIGGTLTYEDVTNVDSVCLLYTSPSPRDAHESRMPSSA